MCWKRRNERNKADNARSTGKSAWDQLTSGLGEHYRDKETAVQPIPASFFTVFASNSNSTRLNPAPYFFVTSTLPSVFYRLDTTDQTGDSIFKYFYIKRNPSTNHSYFTKSHYYSASLILRLHTWALPYLQALVEPHLTASAMSGHGAPNNWKTKPGMDP